MTDAAAILLGALIAVAVTCGCWTVVQLLALAAGREVPRFWGKPEPALAPDRREQVRAWAGLAPEAAGPVTDAACCIHVWEAGESEGHCLECLAVEAEQERARAAACRDCDERVRPVVVARAHRPDSAA